MSQNPAPSIHERPQNPDPRRPGVHEQSSLLLLLFANLELSSSSTLKEAQFEDRLLRFTSSLVGRSIWFNYPAVSSE
jgi:hypothetical protein